MEDPMGHIRTLRVETATGPAFELALTTVATLLHNILEHPEAPKYRTVRLGNATFHNRLGKFRSGLSLLKALGFEDAVQDPAAADGVHQATHLALAEANASDLARGLILVEAARQASVQVSELDKDQQPQVQPEPELPAAGGAGAGSYANGKRPVTALTAHEPAGKRAIAQSPPASGEVGSAGSSSAAVAPEVEDCGEGTLELESYSAAHIDAFFVLHLGDGGSQLGELRSETAFERLVTTARDARSVAAATADAEAEARASEWLRLLVEHGVLNGWADDDADEEDGEADAAATTQGVATAVDASGSSLEVQADGNFDECAVCGGDGSLICCDACPQAYHMECLGEHAPPEDEDEEKAWFCPPCAQQFAAAAAT